MQTIVDKYSILEISEELKRNFENFRNWQDPSNPASVEIEINTIHKEMDTNKIISEEKSHAKLGRTFNGNWAIREPI